MPLIVQNIIIILAVAGCAGFLGWQGWLTLAGRRSKLGSCCSKGCGAANETAKTDQKGERIVFLPAEMLGRKK